MPIPAIAWYIGCVVLYLRFIEWLSSCAFLMTGWKPILPSPLDKTPGMLLPKVICCYFCIYVVALSLPLALSQDIALPPSRSEDQSASEPQDALSLFNLKTPTLGGKQVWTDHAWRRDWRLQQNSLTGHWRLIDPQNVRHAWGSRAACQQELERQVPDATLDTKRVVILLHGLGRSASSMDSLGTEIQRANAIQAVALEYASSRASITDHAMALREVVEGLPKDVDISFVGHSMGNIVVRHAIGDWLRFEDEVTLSRVKHVVMLGPPNQGASIARQLAKVGLFEWITGPGGMELGKGWEDLESQLATPHCPFGIVAGNLPPSLLTNPLVDGQGDFVVSVEETRLQGAADFLEVPRLHSFLMDDPVVQQAVIHFLDHNQFR